MRVKPAKGADGVSYVSFVCQGCDERHVVPVDGPRAWGWNGNIDRPTLTPSILITGKRRITDDEYRRILAGEQLEIPGRVCHTFVTDGRIQFLGDCTHALAGQTADLLEVEPYE